MSIVFSLLFLSVVIRLQAIDGNSLLRFVVSGMAIAGEVDTITIKRLATPVFVSLFKFVFIDAVSYNASFVACFG